MSIKNEDKEIRKPGEGVLEQTLVKITEKMVLRFFPSNSKVPAPEDSLNSSSWDTRKDLFGGAEPTIETLGELVLSDRFGLNSNRINLVNRMHVNKLTHTGFNEGPLTGRLNCAWG